MKEKKKHALERERDRETERLIDRETEKRERKSESKEDKKILQIVTSLRSYLSLTIKLPFSLSLFTL